MKVVNGVWSLVDDTDAFDGNVDWTLAGNQVPFNNMKEGLFGDIDNEVATAQGISLHHSRE